VYTSDLAMLSADPIPAASASLPARRSNPLSPDNEPVAFTGSARIEPTSAEPAESFVEETVSDLMPLPAGTMHATAAFLVAESSPASPPPPNQELEAPDTSIEIEVSPANFPPKFVEVSVSDAAMLCTGLCTVASATLLPDEQLVASEGSALPSHPLKRLSLLTLVGVSISDLALLCTATFDAATA